MSSIHVLVIEDDPDDQEIFALCAARASSEIAVEFAGNATQAIQLLQQKKFKHDPTYIFIDTDLPDMSGLDCLKQIKKLNLVPAAGIRILTSQNEEELIEQSKALGAQDYLIKSPDVEKLINYLRKLLRNEELGS